MVKTLAVIAASAAALFSISAFAAPQKMTSQALDQVVAGCSCDERGNNGWGNGADGTNPGSAAGPTSLSKLAGDNLPPGQDKINTNPTTSSGR